MNGDSKFFIGVAIAAVLVIGGIVFFSAKSKTVNPTPVTNANIDSARGHIRGDANAPITVVEFGDLECPACGAAEPFVRQMLAKHSDVKLSFINFPLPIHPNAVPAARAAEAADKQGKYYQMHDMLYDKQNDWVGLGDPSHAFQTYAGQIGLNVTQFVKDYNSDPVKAKIQSDLDYANSLGTNQTPTFYVNGTQVLGVQTLANWDSLIATAESALKK